MDLSLSGLSKSIQPPEREARRQPGPILDENVIRLFPGSPLQDKMKDQAARAQSILNRIRETRERIDSARTAEVLRDCDLKGIRREVVELEVQTAEINCKLFLQCGGRTSTGELKEVQRALQGDFRLVTQGFHLLERAMSDNWVKLLQLSEPRDDHRANSTGLLEENDPDRSILDLRSRSPPCHDYLESCCMLMQGYILCNVH